MCQRYCDKKQLFTLEMMNKSNFTISCLAQHHVEGGRGAYFYFSLNGGGLIRGNTVIICKISISEKGL